MRPLTADQPQFVPSMYARTRVPWGPIRPAGPRYMSSARLRALNLDEPARTVKRRLRRRTMPHPPLLHPPCFLPSACPSPALTPFFSAFFSYATFMRAMSRARTFTRL
jgi:hypothetical protein